MERRSFVSEDERWKAVLERDRKADGQFYYSVKTTGVYCRPSCGARRPRRENVQFHASCAAAERAGFRPCQRCQPDGTTGCQQDIAKIEKACRSIETAEDWPGSEALARSAGLSPWHFHRVFTRLLGLTPKAYFNARRSARLRQALSRRRTVTEAIYDAGFNANSRFYAHASEILGMHAKHFRAGGSGATIRFAVGECWLGSLLVAATEKGVCAILLGDDPDRLTRELQDRFPKAHLIGGDRKFEQTVSRVVGIVQQPAVACALPLDVMGTAFQQKVWRALQAIPPGRTVTYSEIARRIGAPQAVRAVARACAANVLAVAIPCHRVVRTDGRLSGYRWGVERKRALLEKERAARVGERVNSTKRSETPRRRGV